MNFILKIGFILDKFSLYIYSNSFYLFISVIIKLKNFKIYKILKILYYILFSIIFVKLNIRKLFFLPFFLFPYYFPGFKRE